MADVFPDVRIALSRCRSKKKRKKTYGVRFESMAGEWKYTWAFPIKDSSAKREGYDITIIKGSIEPIDEYPGCPYCGYRFFVICNCGHLNCINVINNIGIFCCEWCGMKGYASGDYDGAGFQSGTDY